MKKEISLLVVFMLFISSIVSPTFASDADEESYGELLATLGVIAGDESGNLKGASKITRAEMVAILVKLTTPKNDSFVLPSTPSFKDVPVDHWAYEFVERAKASNITQGISSDVFGVNTYVNYEQAQAFLLNLLDFSYEWDDVSYICRNERIYIYGVQPYGKSVSRDIVFELLAKALFAKRTGGQLLCTYVAETSNLGWEQSDLEYLANGMQALAYTDDEVEFKKVLDTIDLTTCTFDEKLTPLSDPIWSEWSPFYSKLYGVFFSGVKFASSTSTALKDTASDATIKNGSVALNLLMPSYGQTPFRLEIGSKTATIHMLYPDKTLRVEDVQQFKVDKVYKSTASKKITSKTIVTNFIVDMTDSATGFKYKLAVAFKPNGDVLGGVIFGKDLTVWLQY